MSDGYICSGSVVAGHYEVVRPLGTGSMGVVYHCRHLELNGLDMALKVLSLSNVRRSDSSEEVYQKRFRNELTATYRVNHPHVVRTYEYLNEPGCIAYTMEYVSGGDLEHLIDSAAPLPLAKVAKFLIQTCEGVQAIHEAGIIHRDLKPGNILLTEEGDVKITDFGIARIPDLPRLTAEGSLLGTFAYLSPQYLEDGIGTIASDIYALGTIAFEMITGRLPFDGAGLYHGVTAKISKDAPAVSEFNPDCPIALAEIVSKALERDCAKRYQSATELKEALECIVQDLPEEDFEQLPIGRKEIHLPSLEAARASSKHSSNAIEVIVNPFLQAELGLDEEEKLKAKDGGPRQIEPIRLSLSNSEQRHFWGFSAMTAVLLAVLLVASLAAPSYYQNNLPGPIDAVASELVSSKLQAANILLRDKDTKLEVEGARARLRNSVRAALEYSDELSTLHALAAMEDEVMANVEHRKAAPPQTSPRKSKKVIKQEKNTRSKGVANNKKRISQGAVPALSSRKTRSLEPQTVSMKDKNVAVHVTDQKRRTEPAHAQVASMRNAEPEKFSSEPVVREKPKAKEAPLFMKVRAMLLYRFADYIEWPKDAFASSTSPIELCVIGQDPFGSFLESLASRNKSRKRRPFSIKRFPTMGAKELFSNCHIVYLSQSHSSEAENLEQQLGEKGVLLITENTGFGIIDFVVRERKVKFAINRTRAKRAGLKIGSLLLDIAAEVRT